MLLAVLRRLPRKHHNQAFSICSMSDGDIEQAHRLACENAQDMYCDPTTGLWVMTEYHLRKRGMCCGNGCRHCPYGHANVSISRKSRNILSKPAILYPSAQHSKQYQTRPAISHQIPDLLFWSGGKDSFLAYCELCRHNSGNPVWLFTTFDPQQRAVPIQNIPVRTIVQQAKHLRSPLCLVPLPSGATNDVYIKSINEAIEAVMQELNVGTVNSLVFGDLNVEDIRRWREQSFPNFKLQFPLWKQPYDTVLLPKLWRYLEDYDARVVISAVDHTRPLLPDSIRIGQSYDQDFVQKLQDYGGCDLMGEGGEFHTCLEINSS